ncbi:DUF485 domain-containing protein [Bacillus sp. REN10]|uniref:DUF485 domain-containing protein n=1 Tax=Bacillus sp. REN10 TaxID=2782541 RepID=UPI00193B3D03|nr:DUF485 domain-containing protein [Bacillus sp. REN10]
MSNRLLHATTAESKTKYEKIAERNDFKHLIQTKNKFIISVSCFFLLFYFSLPLLTSYTTILNTPAIGSISWVWLFAFAQFIMTWALCMLYVKKANQFDHMANEILEDIDQQSKGEIHL